jgi:hypothetical protein
VNSVSRSLRQPVTAAQTQGNQVIQRGGERGISGRFGGGRTSDFEDQPESNRIHPGPIHAVTSSSRRSREIAADDLEGMGGEEKRREEKERGEAPRTSAMNRAGLGDRLLRGDGVRVFFFFDTNGARVGGDWGEHAERWLVILGGGSEEIGINAGAR